MFKDEPKNWETRDFDSVFNVLPSKKYQVQKQEYLEKGEIPVVDQGQSLIAGYTNDDTKIFNYDNVIIFGDHTREVKYIDFKFAVGADGTQILNTKENVSLKFAYYQLLNKKIPDMGYNRHFKYVKKEKYLIPKDINEQEEIVQILDCASEIIRLRKECIKDAQDLIPALFQEMFGDITNNKRNYPQTTLKTVANVNPEKNILEDNKNISFLAMKDVSEYGQIDLSTVKQYKDVKVGYTSFKDDDVLLAKITPCFENGKAAIAKNLVGGYGFGSTEFYILRPNKNKILSEYLYSVVKSNRFANIGKLNMKGAAGQKRLTKDFVSNYQFLLPPIKEQELFAQKAIEIEEYIQEQQKELKNLEDMFQSLLHHAFTGKLTAHMNFEVDDGN